GMAELLAATPLSSEQRHYIQTARASCEVLLGLINDILDYSKIEAGKMLLDTTEFNLSDLVDNTAELFREQAQAKQLALRVEYPWPLQRTVVGDTGKIRQILINFLGNAVKFTNAGT